MTEIKVGDANAYIALCKRRDELIKNGDPELRILQSKIDATLNAIGDNPIERCQVIQHIMLQNAYNLSAAMYDVIGDIKVLQEQTEELKRSIQNEITIQKRI